MSQRRRGETDFGKYWARGGEHHQRGIKKKNTERERERIWVKWSNEVFWKTFLKVWCKNILCEKTALFWSWVHAQPCAEVLELKRASQCHVILTLPASLHALYCWVRCFDVNRNLILYFLFISWSCNNLAFCTCHIIYFSVWACVFVFLVSVCVSVCVDTRVSHGQSQQRRL